jgi:hypothetical protein
LGNSESTGSTLSQMGCIGCKWGDIHGRPPVSDSMKMEIEITMMLSVTIKRSCSEINIHALRLV